MTDGSDSDRSIEPENLTETTEVQTETAENTAEGLSAEQRRPERAAAEREDL